MELQGTVQKSCYINYKLAHFGDVLPSQSLGIVLKILYRS